MGNKKLKVFPPMELFFKKDTPENMKFATYKAKWDRKYREKWRIDSRKANTIAPQVLKSINTTCKKIFQIFELSGYARLDLRLTPEGKVYFLEANPNPAIAKQDDFAHGAKQAGVNYEELLTNIVDLAIRS